MPGPKDDDGDDGKPSPKSDRDVDTADDKAAIRKVKTVKEIFGQGQEDSKPMAAKRTGNARSFDEI